MNGSVNVSFLPQDVFVSISHCYCLWTMNTNDQILNKFTLKLAYFFQLILNLTGAWHLALFRSVSIMTSMELLESLNLGQPSW